MIASVGTNLASVRKHCARWITGPTPGMFWRQPLAALMIPGFEEDCALEIVFMYQGVNATVLHIKDFPDPPASGNWISIAESPGFINVIRGSTVNPAGTVIQAPALNGHWYHILAHWQWGPPTQARVEAFLNGVSFGATSLDIPNNWTLGTSSVFHIGGGAPWPNGHVALVRYWKGAPPAAAVLYDLAYIDLGVYAELICQWDMRPGKGNTAYDTEGVFDLPWVPNNQPNALYSSYRYTGQCRGNRWTPP